ncbi:MAG: type II toxin-antitoxin system VapB family antitoxin [Chloroflexi bacterium]|nr:type II toxin-antitoxin system VapB family antitoxin [Chloroflexota bacterium]
MRTTLDIPEELLAKAARLSGKKKKKEIVRLALEDYVRRNARKRLVDLIGKIEIEDLSEELERAELEAQQLPD